MPIMIDRYVKNSFLINLLDFIGGSFIEQNKRHLTITGENIEPHNPPESTPQIVQKLPDNIGAANITLKSITHNITSNCPGGDTPQHKSTMVYIYGIGDSIFDTKNFGYSSLGINDSFTFNAKGLSTIMVEVSRTFFKCRNDTREFPSNIQEITFDLSYKPRLW